MSENPAAGKAAQSKPVTLTIGGRERTLVWDFNAIAEAESLLGGLSIFSNIGRPSALVIRGALWAALRHEDPKLTVDQVGKWITSTKVATAAFDKIVQAWAASEAEKSEGDSENPPPAPASA